MQSSHISIAVIALLQPQPQGRQMQTADNLLRPHFGNISERQVQITGACHAGNGRVHVDNFVDAQHFDAMKQRTGLKKNTVSQCSIAAS